MADVSFKRVCGLLREDVSESMQIWYMARNWLFGLSPTSRKFSFIHGADLAEKSSHPDAVWLTRLFYKYGEDGQRADFVLADKSTFLQLLESELTDSRALIYSYLLSNDAFTSRDTNGFFKRAVEMKNSLALALLAKPGIERLTESVLQDEPVGWYKLYSQMPAEWTRSSHHLNLGRKCLERAATMNHFEAQMNMRLFFPDSDFKHWYWCGRIGAQGHSESENSLFDLAVKTARTYDDPNHRILSGIDRTTVEEAVFMIGKILSSTILNRYPFGHFRNSPWHIRAYTITAKINAGHAVVRMYDSWCQNTRAAVDTWCLIAIRLTSLPRDVRKIVSQLIWKSRSKGLYDINMDGVLIPEKNSKRRRTLTEMIDWDF